jgi:hypothetical protein
MQPVSVEALHLRRARTTRVNIEANAGYDRAPLAQRYELVGVTS